jgi:hypothetical protein
MSMGLVVDSSLDTIILPLSVSIIPPPAAPAAPAAPVVVEANVLLRTI